MKINRVWKSRDLYLTNEMYAGCVYTDDDGVSHRVEVRLAEGMLPSDFVPCLACLPTEVRDALKVIVGKKR